MIKFVFLYKSDSVFYGSKNMKYCKNIQYYIQKMTIEYLYGFSDLLIYSLSAIVYQLPDRDLSSRAGRQNQDIRREKFRVCGVMRGKNHNFSGGVCPHGVQTARMRSGIQTGKRFVKGERVSGEQ